MGFPVPSARVAAFTTITFLAIDSASAAQSCNAEMGSDAAQIYVEQCLQVSPATRPPCKGENPCQLIWDEIARGCAMLDEDAPEFCSDY